MNQTIFRISLDVHEIYSRATLSLKKGDTSGKLIVTLTEQGKPYIIEDDCYAIFSGVKENGSVLHNDCMIQNNKIIYDFTAETTSAAGRIECDIVLYNDENQAIISPSFAIIVHDSVHSEEIAETSNEYNSLVGILTEGKKLINSVETKLKNGEFDGVSVEGVKQTTTSEEDGGTNVITCTLSDGTVTTFEVKNGNRGHTGAKIVSTEIIGTNEDGENVYKQTFDDGSTTIFVVPHCDISGKVDKVSTNYQVYGTNNKGEQTTYPVRWGATRQSLVIRDDSGQITVGTPTAPESATTKQYVDEHIDANKNYVDNKIVEVVAGADTSFDTLKEIADWIKAHPDSVATINSLIQKNADDIATNAAKITTLFNFKAEFEAAIDERICMNYSTIADLVEGLTYGFIADGTIVCIPYCPFHENINLPVLYVRNQRIHHSFTQWIDLGTGRSAFYSFIVSIGNNAAKLFINEVVGDSDGLYSNDNSYWADFLSEDPDLEVVIYAHQGSS